VISVPSLADRAAVASVCVLQLMKARALPRAHVPRPMGGTATIGPSSDQSRITRTLRQALKTQGPPRPAWPPASSRPSAEAALRLGQPVSASRGSSLRSTSEPSTFQLHGISTCRGAVPRASSSQLPIASTYTAAAAHPYSACRQPCRGHYPRT